MKKIFRPTTVVNIFGAIGYVLLIVTWAFFVAIVIALIFDSSIRTNPTDIIQNSGSSLPAAKSSPVLVAAGYAITGLVIIVSIGVLVMAPYYIGKWGSRLLRRLMLALKVDITKRQLFLVKCMLATLPLVGFMSIHFMLAPDTMAFAAMYLATVALSVLSISLFSIQLFVARHLKVSIDQTW